MYGIPSGKAYTYGDSNWKDKLTSYDGRAITYDEIGNPLSYRSYTLAWQNGRQLAMLSGNGIAASYTYDVDGLRTSKTVNGVKHEYYYVGSRLQYEKYGDTELWFFYDAWGNVTKHATSADTQGITETNPIRYRGYYYDTETGLYYLKSRHYDPATRRFLNADGYVATGQGILGNNMFSYCDNNPVNREDSTGHFWKQLKAKVKNSWNGFKSWVNSTFGAGKKVSSTISKVEHQYVPDPWPITVKVGSKITQTVYKSNNYSKSVTAYIDSDIMAPMSSTAGLKVNFENV